MRKLLVVAAWLLGIVGFMVLAFTYDSLSRRTAQADGEHAALWVFTPHVGPGDVLRGEVETWRGLALGIRRVRVQFAGAEAEVSGRGRHWGGSLTTKSTTRGSDDLEFAITLPADLSEGPAQLTVAVEYAYARRSMGGFVNSNGAEELAVELPIRGSPARIGLRAWSGARGLIGLLLLTLLYLRFGPGLTKDDPGMSESETEGLAYLMICVAVFVAIAGYPLFAQPMMAATGWTADGFVIGLMFVWILGPPIAAWRIHKRRPQTAPWRLHFPGSDGRTDPASVLRLLEMRSDLTVRRRRKGFVVRRDRKRFARFALADRDRFEAGTTAEASDQDLLFEVTLAIAEKTGPLTLVASMMQLAVDRHSTLESLQSDYQKQAQVALERMMVQIREMQASMDRLGLGK